MRQTLTGLPARITNLGLDATTRIGPNVVWPLVLLPLLLIVQLTAPSPIWIGLICAWVSIYAFSYGWLRLQVPRLSLQRRALSQVLLVGDELEVESLFSNSSIIPVLWCRVVEKLPEHQRVSSERVVACASQTYTDWSETHVCHRRGRLQLGPTELVLGDPVGLFQAARAFGESIQILVHPRVIVLPEIACPQRSLRGNVQHRRRLRAEAKAPTIRQYAYSDSHRLIHWPSTARQGELMVAELESEPGTRLTVVLNLHGPDHVGEGATGTLEFAISVAGSLVAQTVHSSDRQQCGLLCAETETTVSSQAPGQGAGHMWAGLRLLAGVNAGEFPLHQLLARSHLLTRARQEDSLLVVTPHPAAALPVASGQGAQKHRQQRTMLWLAELHAQQQRGLDCGILLVRHPSQRGARIPSHVQALLAAFPLTVLETDDVYTPLITYRRQRKEFLTTPFGGVVEVSVEEVVG